jgi:hypothetical protein
MTEPSPARPVPGPPPSERTSPADPFDDLDRRPVAEHVAVFETEHDRLQRELGTIDQL